MILTHHQPFFNLAEFQIDVPLDERIHMVLKHLKDNYSSNIYASNEFDQKFLTESDLLLVHDLEYVNLLLENDPRKAIEVCFELDQYGTGQTNIDYSKLRDKIFLQALYTYYGMKIALEKECCYFLGGGMHHAMSFAGRGFCLINDIVIGARKLLKQNLIKKVWVVDIDAHKGDGTSQVTYQDHQILTLSIHMKNAWPTEGVEKDHPSLLPSNIDLPIGINEERTYLNRLKTGLHQLEKIDNIPADLVIIIDGADPYEFDELPGTKGLKLNKLQMLMRDKMVYHFFKERQIPQLYLMGGGYGSKAGEIYIQFLDWLLKENNLE